MLTPVIMTLVMFSKSKMVTSKSANIFSNKFVNLLSHYLVLNQFLL